MSRLSGVILCLAAFLSVQADARAPRQLSCQNSALRLLFPEYFTHCTDCIYHNWSDWEIVPDSIDRVPVSQCSSGEVYNETRTQIAVGAGCKSKMETKQVCTFLSILYKKLNMI